MRHFASVLAALLITAPTAGCGASDDEPVVVFAASSLTDVMGELKEDAPDREQWVQQEYEKEIEATAGKKKKAAAINPLKRKPKNISFKACLFQARPRDTKDFLSQNFLDSNVDIVAPKARMATMSKL